MSEEQNALKLLRVPEVAKLLSCREQHVWSMIYRREIASVVIGKRSRRVPLSAIEELIDRGMQPALAGGTAVL